jgi:hypothetical protein
MDQAITPVCAGETETLEMFTHNAAARSQVAHIRKVAELTSGKSARAASGLAPLPASPAPPSRDEPRTNGGISA